jgi:hypothetical protein
MRVGGKYVNRVIFGDFLTIGPETITCAVVRVMWCSQIALHVAVTYRNDMSTPVLSVFKTMVIFVPLGTVRIVITRIRILKHGFRRYTISIALGSFYMRLGCGI